MTLIQFPNPRDSRRGDIIGVGGELTVENLVNAYRRGIFPWPIDDWPLTWFCPRERAILRFENIHIPRSLKRAQNSASFAFTIDRAFDEVIHACASANRPEQDGTWITAGMIDAYRELHRAGHAHSVEVWKNDDLVGGIYGVDAGGAFGGESMFFRAPNASKLALLHLVDHLHARGLDWIDIQVMTPHMEALGAETLRRARFLDLLDCTLARSLVLF